MKTVMCEVCGTTADVPTEQGTQPDMPIGWATASLAQRGQQIEGALLCPGDAQNVRAAMNALVVGV